MCRLYEGLCIFPFPSKKNDNVMLMGPITYGVKYSICHLLQLA